MGCNQMAPIVSKKVACGCISLICLITIGYLVLVNKDSFLFLHSGGEITRMSLVASPGSTTGALLKLESFRRYGNVPNKQPTIFPEKNDYLFLSKCQELDKWAVVTTISEKPTEAMIKVLEEAREWCVLVIGDKKSPDVYAVSGDIENRFIFFSPEAQEALPFQLVKLTPWNSFSRKNIGFLYAMKRGAKIIFDMDDDNVPILVKSAYLPVQSEQNSFKKAIPAPSSDTQSSKAVAVFNPYPYFGATDAWPRGFPLTEITASFEVPADKTETHTCYPIVQQYVANNNPDVDAIFRLSKKLPLDFEANRESIVLPSGVVCSYNAQATMHLYEAFWSMLLPKTVSGRVSDIWRAYIAQSLFYLVKDACLMFCPPGVTHHRNVHNYLQDFDSELPLYLMTEEVINFLYSLPHKHQSFRDALVTVYIRLYEVGVVEKEDVEYVLAWTNDLLGMGYEI